MTFQLVVTLPEGDLVENPAFFPVCRVPVLTRMLLGAARAGGTDLAVLGEPRLVEHAQRTVGRDPRVEALGVSFGEVSESDAPRVTAVADVVASTLLFRELDAAPAPAHVPGVTQLRKGEGANSTPLFEGAPPKGVYAVPIGARADIREAKRAIFRHITKTTSGPVSRHVNARLTIPLSKILVETSLTPNQMTWTNTAIGVIGAAFCAVGSLGALAVAGLTLQLTSALDRVDGELARSKLMESEHGAWIDSVGDNITYVAYMVGFMIGYARFAEQAAVAWAPYALPLGFGTILLTVFLIGAMFLYVRKNNLGGTMTAISHDFRARVDAETGLTFRMLDKVKVLGERDQFSIAFMVFAVLPWLLSSPGAYHTLFFTIVAFTLLANLYFALGKSLARKRRSPARART